MLCDIDIFDEHVAQVENKGPPERRVSVRDREPGASPGQGTLRLTNSGRDLCLPSDTPPQRTPHQSWIEA